MTETIQTAMDRLMTISVEPQDYVAEDGDYYLEEEVKTMRGKGIASRKKSSISYISVFVFRVFNTRKYMKYKVLTKEFLIGSLALMVSGILIYRNDIIAQTIQILILLIVIALYKEIWLRLWNKVTNKI